MATIRYTGQSIAVAQVDTFTPGGTIEVGDSFILTATGENGDTVAITFVATDTTPANVSAGVIAAWNASGHYLCTPITATGSTTVILTADTTGQPFSVASTTGGEGAATETFVRAATTASKGPFDWNDVDNWDSGALPGAGDTIIMEGVTVLYGLDQSGGNNPNVIDIKNSQIGQNPPAGILPAYLVTTATTGPVTIGQNFNPGVLTQATPVYLDLETSAGTVTVHATGTNSTSTLPAVFLKMNNAGALLEVQGGTVGLGYHDEAGQVSDIIVTGGSLYLGENIDMTAAGKITVTGGLIDTQGTVTNAHTYYVTGGTVNQRGDLNAGVLYLDGGTYNLFNDLPTVHMTAGTLTTKDAAGGVQKGITTLNMRGGNTVYKSTGLITNANLYAGTLDMTSDNKPRIITNLAMGSGATVKMNAATTTLTNDIVFTTDDASGVRTVSVA